MGTSQNDGTMEGWLYLIRSNRFGLQFSRKRYFVLDGHLLKSFKSVPTSNNEDPVRSAIVDSCIRVMDNGRESINRKVFFLFTLYNTSNHSDQLKLGASRPEEAARWIQSFQEASLKGAPDIGDIPIACSKRRWQSFRLSGSSSRSHSNSLDWTLFSDTHSDPMTSDVVAPSPWIIFGCQNGLRLFKEAKERDSQGKKWDDHPAIMAVGVVDGTSEAIFRTLMSLGPSRSEWDFCFYQGNVVEHLDGHTDIIHKQLYSDWLPWGMKRRDLLLRRYWRREDGGTYVILYHSVFHKKCPAKKGYVRACLKSGGYVISPVNKGKQSVVKHMLAIDWKFWKSYLKSSSAHSITVRMLERVAALRELYRARLGNCSSSDYSSGELTSSIRFHVNEGDSNFDIQTQTGHEKTHADIHGEVDQAQSEHASLVGLNDADDEFFDVPEPSDCDESENGWTPDCSHKKAQESRHPKLSTAASFVRRLHDLAVQKRGYVDLQETVREESISCSYGATLPKDPICTIPCSWTEADPSTFLIRGENYLEDRQKVKAKGTLMQMVGADWLRSDIREDDLGGRPGSIVQVPGSTTYSLALYYMMNTPIQDSPLLESFVNGDDAYRNSRFKLIPYISKGSWIVKQSVGKKACLVGQALEINYFQGKNYLELGVDIGSSTVARGVVSLVLGYLNNLVIEMAFLIQGNTPEELPEYLLGTCRLNHLDASKSVGQRLPVSFLKGVFGGSKLIVSLLAIHYYLFVFFRWLLVVNSFWGFFFLALALQGVGILWMDPTLKFCALLMLVGLVNASVTKNDFGRCERVVRNWAYSSLDKDIREDKHKLRDLLFFLHVPRTGGRTYFHCFLKKLYPSSLECPRSYDKLRFDPSQPKCRLLVTHDDYSITTKLPKERTSVVTILRDPISRVFSTYEFSIEVAARFLVHPNLTSATRMAGRMRSRTKGVSTLDIWPWKYLVPWMREDLFTRRDLRQSRGLPITESNDSYDMEDLAMPLQEFINHPVAKDIVHNGATFQVAGLTNNSYLAESDEVRHCVQRYKILGKHVLQVAKKRLADMLYVGLTEEHRESATMFANVVGAQVISQLRAPNTSMGSVDNAEQSSLSISEPDSHEHQNSTLDSRASETASSEATESNMTVDDLMEAYEVCISSLRKAQAQRRTASMKRISPVNFSNECLNFKLHTELGFPEADSLLLTCSLVDLNMSLFNNCMIFQARVQVSEAVLQQIKFLNDLDLELYEYARELFSKQHKNTFLKFTEEKWENMSSIANWKDINNMKDSWFFDKNFNGLSDEIFDDVKFFDFPLEDIEPDAVEEDWDAQFKHLEEPSFDVFSVPSSGLCDKTQKGHPKLGRISTPCDEISPLEQLPETAGPKYIKSTPNQNVSSNGKDLSQFRTYSPVSVFESSSSSSGENAFDQPVIPKRARGKRRRLSIFSPLFSIPFIASPLALQKSRRAAASDSDFEAHLTGKSPFGVKRKQRKKDLRVLSGHVEMKRFSSQESIIPRKCMHCQVTKTPQWREGPMGPKTLCNACGVRYRSGRLFPEYRPAASPTFVASLHSNCHKKVLEMRNGAIPAPEADKGSKVPLSSNLSGNSLG
ncbi:protein ENHANCED DISEASE RESISTANCE 2-like [Senna tora]|uniref:Protein ENHANCED DISEASE RESISTANCE 2-like n=1 Tax=Senna tora TaxID=362788 RepID=A0A834SKX1_9FABA|nr:protein ENHANCED DISEASE RESISTANCE 2-like [Senna tora]